MKKMFVCIIFGGITELYASKILAVFPTPSFSHHIVFRPLIHELARRGHDVTVITPFLAFPKGKTLANLTEIDVHDVSYSIWKREMKKVAIDGKYSADDQIKLYKVLSAVFEQQLHQKEVQDIVENKTMHFNLILAEACAKPALIFSGIFNARVIQISSFGPLADTNIIAGAPNHPLLYPSNTRRKLYNLTFWEKILETYQQFRFNYLYLELESEQNKLLRNIFGPDTLTLNKLYNNVEIVFLNLYSLWNDNQPIPPNTIYVGGIHFVAGMELPEDIKSYLDRSKNGVIYISFGTNVHSSIFPPLVTKMMMKVFSELPYDVIWKWDEDLLEKPHNIKIVKWSPQSDLIHHKNVKLFITQGGLQSTDEAIAAGVPLIGLPVLGDQWYNVQKYVRYGIGMELQINTLTENDFKNAIVKVIEDQRYRNNINRLRTLMHDQSQSSLESAIWWTEYVLRHGGAKHLRAPAANMSLTEYYELNYYCFLHACLVLLVLFVYLYIIYNDISLDLYYHTE